MKKIGVIVGSLRKESYNKKIAEHIIKNFDPSYDVELLEIGNLVHYNEDLDADAGSVPAEYTAFREKVADKDGFIFVTPEYNRSVPSALKNALDVASRPYGSNVWDGKPALVISSSTGATGGFGANHHLRQSLVFLNMPTLQQPEAYLGKAHEFFDEAGNLVVESTANYIQSIVDAYLAFGNKLR